MERNGLCCVITCDEILISHIKEAIEEEGGEDLHRNLEGYRILEQFVLVAQSMVSRIMCDSCTDGDITQLEVYIKIFLAWSETYCQTFEGKESKETFTATKGNFLSLLNLPKQMRRFGPMRRYWDGDYEKFIGYVKQILPGGINREGSATLVAKLRRFKETVAVESSTEEAKAFLNKKGVLPPKRTYTRYKDVHVYKSREEIEEKLKEMKTISGILSRGEVGTDRFIQVAYRVKALKRSVRGKVFEQTEDDVVKQAINSVSIVFDDGKGRWIAGAYYSRPTIVNNRSYEECDITLDTFVDDASKYVCLIPKIELRKQFMHWRNQVCTVVADDWTERVEDNEYKTSSLHRSIFP